MTVMDAPPAEIRFLRCLGCFRSWSQADVPVKDPEVAMCICTIKNEDQWIWVDGPRDFVPAL